MRRSSCGESARSPPLPRSGSVCANARGATRPAAASISVRVECRGPTGVEMEALTGAAVGLLTVYDMVKAIDRGMTLGDVRLEEKSGGRSGVFRRAGS